MSEPTAVPAEHIPDADPNPVQQPPVEAPQQNESSNNEPIEGKLDEVEGDAGHPDSSLPQGAHFSTGEQPVRSQQPEGAGDASQDLPSEPRGGTPA